MNYHRFTYFRWKLTVCLMYRPRPRCSMVHVGLRRPTSMYVGDFWDHGRELGGNTGKQYFVSVKTRQPTDNLLFCIAGLNEQ